MSSSSSSAPDHHHLSSSSPEKLCYVHCSYCDTILAVSVPCACLFKTVTVRCGHCTNLLSVNTSLLLSSNQLHLGHSFFTPQNLLEEIRYLPSNLLINQQNPNAPFIPVREIDELPTPPSAKRPPEKRQRVPSAYNRFIKDEIQRIKAGNPDISHREAFSAAAKNFCPWSTRVLCIPCLDARNVDVLANDNPWFCLWGLNTSTWRASRQGMHSTRWAHFPHIHFGLMPDQLVKKPDVMCLQEGGDDHVLMKDGFLAAANMGLSPY
ncbi:hypothetical protein OROHE_004920 [Orobanche hederae]